MAEKDSKKNELFSKKDTEKGSQLQSVQMEVAQGKEENNGDEK